MTTIKAGFTGHMGGLTPLMDENNFPKYSNTGWYHTPLFDYRWQQILPDLTFTDSIGVKYQLDRHFQTDGGSVPPFARFIPGIHLDPFNFPRAYVFHDETYQYGGLYIKYPYDDVFKFRLQTRQQADARLADMLPFDGATRVDQAAINGGIWVGSRFVWNDKKPAKQLKARKEGGIVVYDYVGNILPE